MPFRIASVRFDVRTNIAGITREHVPTTDAYQYMKRVLALSVNQPNKANHDTIEVGSQFFVMGCHHGCEPCHHFRRIQKFDHKNKHFAVNWILIIVSQIKK